MTLKHLGMGLLAAALFALVPACQQRQQQGEESGQTEAQPGTGGAGEQPGTGGIGAQMQGADGGQATQRDGGRSM